MMADTAARNFENSCHVYEKICLCCGIGAVIFLLLSAILFFALHIPRAFGEFTGRTARRAVRRMDDLQRDQAKASGIALRPGETETALLPSGEVETIELPGLNSVAKMHSDEVKE